MHPDIYVWYVCYLGYGKYEIVLDYRDYITYTNLVAGPYFSYSNAETAMKKYKRSRSKDMIRNSERYKIERII